MMLGLPGAVCARASLAPYGEPTWKPKNSRATADATEARTATIHFIALGGAPRRRQRGVFGRAARRPPSLAGGEGVQTLLVVVPGLLVGRRIGGIRGAAEGVVQLEGILDQVVVLFVSVIVAGVVAALHTQHLPAGRYVVDVPLAEDGGAGPGEAVVLCDREDAAPVHEAGDARAAHAGQGRRYVVTAGELRALLASCGYSRSAHDQREVRVLLVGHELAVRQAVLTEVGPIIGVEHE